MHELTFGGKVSTFYAQFNYEWEDSFNFLEEFEADY